MHATSEQTSSANRKLVERGANTGKARAGNDWYPGMPSPNPTGRPRDTNSLRERAREMSPTCLEQLFSIARDSKEKTADRIDAAELILAYGHGRPHQAIVSAHLDVDDFERLQDGLDEAQRAAAANRAANHFAQMIGARPIDSHARTIEHEPVTNAELHELWRQEEAEPVRRVRRPRRAAAAASGAD